MTIHYGIDGCKHRWVYRKDGWAWACTPAICADCGAFGCECDSGSLRGKPYENKLTADANPNGKWINPYVTGERKRIVK